MSRLDPGNRLVHTKTQLQHRKRRRNCPISCGSLGCHGLGRGGEHRASEDHSGPARELFPLRTENALGDHLIRWLRGGKDRQAEIRQKNEGKNQHASRHTHRESLSGGNRTGRGPGSGIRVARSGSGRCAGGHCGFVMNWQVVQAGPARETYLMIDHSRRPWYYLAKRTRHGRNCHFQIQSHLLGCA